MVFFDSVLDREEEVRNIVDHSNFESDGAEILGEDGNLESTNKEILGEGGNSVAVRSPNGYVLKGVDEDVEFLEERESELSQIQIVPDNEVVVVLYCEGKGEYFNSIVEAESGDNLERSGLVRMREANLTHKDAIKHFGFDEVIEKDFQMFSNLAREGILYEDFKPANIGYFRVSESESQGFEDMEPLPIDLYDSDSLTNEEFTIVDFHKIAQLYMTGNSDESGLTRAYEIDDEEACSHVIDALAENPAEIKNNRHYNVDDVLRNFYRDNLR